jgi:hypothetical protein
MSKPMKAEGLSMYCKVFDPDKTFEKQYGVYSVDLLKTEEDAQKLSEYLQGLIDERHAEEVKASKKPESLSTRSPCDVFTDKKTGLEYTRFKFKMKAGGVNNNGEPWHQKPAVFDAKRNVMSGENLIGNMSRVKIAFVPATYCVQNVVGVTLKMEAVQVIDLVPWKDPKAMFDDEDGYTESAVEKDDRQDTPFDTDSETVDAEGDF